MFHYTQFFGCAEMNLSMVQCLQGFLLSGLNLNNAKQAHVIALIFMSIISIIVTCTKLSICLKITFKPHFIFPPNQIFVAIEA